MKVAIRTDFCGNDIDRVSEYASKLGIGDIWAFPEVKECYNEAGHMEVERLKRYQKGFDERGLDLRLLTEIIDEDAVLSTGSAETKAKALCQTIDAMGKVGIDTLFLLVGILSSKGRHVCEERWRHLIEIYEEIVPGAEEAGVRIANHGHQVASYLIWNYDGMNRLLEAVPSDYNGVTFCTGCYQLAGDNIYDSIRRFGGKIFFVHARDVIRKPDGFDEVIFGRGEVDIFRILKQLQHISYQGLVCPEHLPKIDYEPYEEITIAWGLGYLVSALSTLQK